MRVLGILSHLKILDRKDAQNALDSRNVSLLISVFSVAEKESFCLDCVSLSFVSRIFKSLSSDARRWLKMNLIWSRVYKICQFSWDVISKFNTIKEKNK